MHQAVEDLEVAEIKAVLSELAQKGYLLQVVYGEFGRWDLLLCGARGGRTGFPTSYVPVSGWMKPSADLRCR